MNAFTCTALPALCLFGICSCGSTEPQTPEDCRHLADCYLYGREEQYINPRKAVRYYSKAATMGDAESQESLGNIFAEGRCVETDWTKAVHYYTLAAESWKQQGSCRQVVPQYKLGQCYELGRGVRRDILTAINWYRQASQVPGVPADMQACCPAAARLAELEKITTGAL